MQATDFLALSHQVLNKPTSLGVGKTQRLDDNREMSIEKSEYEVEVFCPKCGSKDVVLNFHLGFFTFNSCNKCSYKIERVNDNL